MKKKGLIALTLCLALACPAALAETVDMIDVLLNSKTTQAFTQEDLAEEDLNTILLCGINAQSAMNSQPWHFSVLTDDETLAALDSGSSAPTGAEDESAEDAGEDAAPAASDTAKASVADAAAAIVISTGDALKWNSFDAGGACDRMSIAARALGYGSKIVAAPCDTINANQAWKDYLGIPEDMESIAILLLGIEDTAVDGSSGASVRNDISDVVTLESAQ